VDQVLRTTVPYLKQKWIAIMKLSSLLLSTAALVVAGSAYAADLPAKKGAPAAKAATGCPAFGAGFFQIPGGDTCIRFSGFARYDLDNDGSAFTQGADARLTVDARNNSEMGAVRSVIRIDADAAGALSADRAFVELGGFTAGRKGSQGDISGTNLNVFGSGLGGGDAIGASYKMAFGNINAELGVADNSSGLSDQLDGYATLSTKAAGADLTVVGVTHQNDIGSGYAVLGRAGFSAGQFGAALFGGYSSGAISETGAPTGYADSDGVDSTVGTNFGGELSLAAGNGTFYIDAVRYTADIAGASDSVTSYGVGYAATVAKGLTVTPEFTTADDTADTTSNTFRIRIQRDF